MHSRYRSITLCSALLLASNSAFAQSQTATPPSDKPGETVVLSTFEVRSEKDFGYRATNSMTATGFGTEIYATPISVSVVTKDLISDIGAGLLRETLQYTSAITTSSRDPNQNRARGFLIPIQVNRMAGNVRNPNADFIERVEIVKGPNAVFFGRVAPGGLINLTTLQPFWRTASEVKATYGSYDYKKLMVDHNQVITDNLAIRVAGSFLDRSDGYVDWTYKRDNAGYAALAWRITDKVQFNANFQQSAGTENVSVNGSRTNASYLASGSTLTIQGWAAPALGNVPANVPYINLIAPYAMFPNGLKGNNDGPEAYKKDDATATQVQLVAQPTDWLSLRFDASWDKVSDDSFVISGYPKPNGDIVAAGVRYADGSPVKDRFYQGEGVFKFKLGPTKHQFLVGARYYDRDVRSYFFTGNTVTQNFFTGGPRLLVSTFGLSIDPAARNAYLYTRTLDEAFYAVDQIDLFNGRLKLLAGARNAAITNKKTVTNLTERTQRETTPQFGLWFEVAKDVALFANYSKTFEPQYNIDTFGVLSPNIRGEGKEIGVKTSFRDNLVSGTVSLYEVTRKGEVRRDFVREQTTGVLPLFIPGGDQRARGFEAEFTYTPAKNYQLVLSYSWMFDAEVIRDTVSPWLVGRRLPLSPEHSLSLWNRYTFTTGPLRGVFLGGGVRYNSSAQSFLDTTFDLVTPAYTVVDAVAGYESKWSGNPVKYQLNVKNLGNEKYYDGPMAVPADPLTAYFSVEFRF
jgi:outer membrane receptor protein involved in Fe transport